jgi:hypothetical protein
LFILVSFSLAMGKFHEITLTTQNSGTIQGLISVSPVNSRVRSLPHMGVGAQAETLSKRYRSESN